MQKEEFLNAGVLFKTKNGNFYLQNLNGTHSMFIPDKLAKVISHNSKTKKTRNTTYYDEKFKFISDHILNDKSLDLNLVPSVSNSYIFDNLVDTTQLTFELTDKCNLRCKYCGYGDLYSGYDARTNKDLHWKMAMKFIDYFINIWSNFPSNSVKKPIAIGFYGGEPLLNINLIKEIVSYLETNAPKDISFSYHMTTNALLLNRYIEYFIEKKFVISISMDGNEINHSYRVTKNNQNSFQVVFKNALLIKNKHSEYFDSNVHFISVLHNRNSMEDISSFFKTNFDKVPTILEVNPDGVIDEHKDEFLELYSNKWESIQNAKNPILKEDLFLSEPSTRLLTSYIHQYSGNVVKNYRDFFLDQNQIRYLPTGTCTPFSRKVFLTVNGKILPCERIDHQFVLGKVTEDSVDIDCSVIANNYTNAYNRIIDQCKRCFKRKSCEVCMFTSKDMFSHGKCNDFAEVEKITQWFAKAFETMEENPHLYNKIMDEVLILK